MSFRVASAISYINNAGYVISVVMPAGTIPSDTVLLPIAWGTSGASTVTVTPPVGAIVGTPLVPARNNNNVGWAVPKVTGVKAGDVVTLTMSILVNKICQALVLTSDVGLVGALGSRNGVSLSTCIAPEIVSTAASSVMMFSIERTTANPTTVTSVVSAAGDAVTTRSYAERAGDPDVSFFLGEFNNSKNPTDTATITYSGPSGNGVAFLFQSVRATPNTVDSAGAKFWNGTAWVALAKGPKGAKGATGPAGTSTPPVKSLGSRSLAINGSRASTPVAASWRMSDLTTRVEETNSPITVSGDAYSFVNLLPWSYFVSVHIAINGTTGNWNNSERMIVSIARLRADGSIDEIARRNKTVKEANFTVSGVFNQVSPTDKLVITGFSSIDFGAFTSVLTVSPIGPLTLPTQIVDHVDYTSAGTRVGSYTLTPIPASQFVPGILPDDWMYLIHEHFRETADIVPTLPAGWVPVVAPQTGGSPTGIEWSIWRKKRVAGETGYTVTLSSDRYCRATLLTIRQHHDDMPALSALTAQRGAATPSVITVPGGVQAVPGALVVAVALQNTASTSFTPPPTMSGGPTHLYSVPAVASTTFFSVATQQASVAGLINPTVFNWTPADAGRVGGIAMIFLPTAVPRIAVKAIDSVNTVPDQAWFAARYAEGYRLYVLHSTEWPPSTAPWWRTELQLGWAVAAGFKIAAYVRDPDNWAAGIDACGPYASQLQFFAIDVETDPGKPVTRAMVNGIRARGVRPVIYSGSGMWAPIMGSAQNDFSDVPLWDTSTNPAIDPATWVPDLNSPTPVTYGGWNTGLTKVGNPRFMVQQKFEAVIDGVNVDLNSVDQAFLV